MTMIDHTSLTRPLTLPNGSSLLNRLGKAPLSEGLADADNRVSPELVTLYRRWGAGGAGLIVTGNVQVDGRYLERPANVALDPEQDPAPHLPALRAMAAAGRAGGAQHWMQLNHPGRQSPRAICSEPVAPSAIALKLSQKAFAPPRAMTPQEVLALPRRFAFAASIAAQAGFTGVQVHAAHGYLLSQFLSPLSNRRDDQWGGSLENRARVLLEVIAAIRAATPERFCVAVKLNSSDFQLGGFSEDDCVRLVAWLEQAGIDCLELSGGNYEQPAMLGAAVRESTRARQGYFLQYAARVRQATALPIMLSGGFRSRLAMEQALDAGACDIIGLGRPLCVDPALPARLLSGQSLKAEAWEERMDASMAAACWFSMQLVRIGGGADADVDLPIEQAIDEYKRHEQATGARWAERRRQTG